MALLEVPRTQERFCVTTSVKFLFVIVCMLLIHALFCRPSCLFAASERQKILVQVSTASAVVVLVETRKREQIDYAYGDNDNNSRETQSN